MKDQFVYDPLISKRQQYLLATQVCFPPNVSNTSSVLIWPVFKLVRAVLKIGSCCFTYPTLTLAESFLDDVIISGQTED